VSGQGGSAALGLASTVLRIRAPRAVDSGAYADPAGPDGEGKARNARGEPSQVKNGT